MALSLRFVQHLCSRTLNRNHKILFSLPCKSARPFSCSSLLLNSQRRYAEKHEWITLNGKIGTVGVTHYAQDSLGDVVYVQLPEVGADVEADGEVGVIESVKAVSELYSPVSGCVTEVNTALEAKPSLINEACYDEGWVYKLELKNPEDVNKLMTEQQYEEYLKTMD